MVNFSDVLIQGKIYGFGLSMTIILLLGACKNDDDDLSPPVEATISSTIDLLQGGWALVRVTGGIAGIDENYTTSDSPEILTFQSDSTLKVETKTDTTLQTNFYSVLDVTSSNDTIFFSFGSAPGNINYFHLSGRPMLLIDSEKLVTEIICCDQFDYAYVKL